MTVEEEIKVEQLRRWAKALADNATPPEPWWARVWRWLTRCYG